MGGDHTLHAGAGLDNFDLFVKRVECHHGRGFTFIQGVLELPFGVGGVDRAEDGACFPGAQLGDDGLGRIGQ